MLDGRLGPPDDWTSSWSFRLPSTVKTRRLALLLMVLSTGCFLVRRESNTSTPPAGGPARTPPTDPEIVAILLAANNTDISYARLAPSRAQSEAVKGFAARMLSAHTAVNNQITELASTLHLSPE